VPSPQSLVVFMLTLLVLLLATRVQLELSPAASAATSSVLALLLAWFVDRHVPPDEEDEEADIVAEVPGTQTTDADSR
jgi:hypothetical protein